MWQLGGYFFLSMIWTIREISAMTNIPKAKSSVHVIIPITPSSYESGAKKITPEKRGNRLPLLVAPKPI